MKPFDINMTSVDKYEKKICVNYNNQTDADMTPVFQTIPVRPCLVTDWYSQCNERVSSTHSVYKELYDKTKEGTSSNITLI